MIEINKTAIVPYQPSAIFALVTDIPNYPKYLPWCKRAEIQSQSVNEVIGAVYIEYLKIRTHFITKNINTAPTKIEMTLVDGPFKHLSGTWEFTPLGPNGCKISFNLKYQFSNHLLEKLIGPVFGYISKNIMDHFIQEANKRYQ